MWLVITVPPGGAPADAAGGSRPRRSIFDIRAHVRFWSVAILGLALDLGSKEWAFHALRQGGRRVLIPHVLEFQTMMNDGALFGIGGGRTTLFLLASALALVLVLWMFTQTSARNWLVQIALGAVLAGALGNMYDRMFVRLVVWREPGTAWRYYEQSPGPDERMVVLREYPVRAGEPGRVLTAREAEQLEVAGYVRDFIKIPTKLFGNQDLWPWVFNIADTLLVCGVGILALRLWRDREPSRVGAGKGVDAGKASERGEGSKRGPVVDAAAEKV